MSSLPRVCASGVKQSVLFVCRFCCCLSLKKLQIGDLEAVMISKQEINAEIHDTLACLYLI